MTDEPGSEHRAAVRLPFGTCKRRAFAGCIAIMVLAASFAAPAFAAPALRSVDKASAQGGFIALASVVTDKDWLKIWRQPTPGVGFHTTDTLHAGQKATILVMFSNARARNGQVALTCEIRIHSTDGTPDQHQPATPCFQGPAPPPNVLMLTELEIGLKVRSRGKPSLTEFDIEVTDVAAGRRVPLRLVVGEVPEKP